MSRLYQFWNQHYRPLLLIVAFIALAIWLAVARQALAPPPTPTAYPTATPYPTYTPYPTSTPVPFDYALLNAIYERIQVDDTIPALGKKPVISLIGYTNPKRTGPWRRFHDLIIDAYGDPGEDYPLSMDHRSGRMPRISVDDVLGKVELWQRSYALQAEYRSPFIASASP